MAPRLPEPRDVFLKRLKDSLARGLTEIRFGDHHFSHAVCREGDVWRLRRLETTSEEREAYVAKRGFYMPESEEEIAKPRTILFETRSFDELLAHLRTLPWP